MTEFYPYPVESVILKGLESLDEFIVSNEIDIDILIELLARPLLERYELCQPIRWTEGEVEDIMKKSLFLSSLKKLEQ